MTWCLSSTRQLRLVNSEFERRENHANLLFLKAPAAEQLALLLVSVGVDTAEIWYEKKLAF